MLGNAWIGQIKVFRNWANLLAEYRLYRRDRKGRVVKQNDHLMDAHEVSNHVWTGSGNRAA